MLEELQRIKYELERGEGVNPAAGALFAYSAIFQLLDLLIEDQTNKQEK